MKVRTPIAALPISRASAGVQFDVPELGIEFAGFDDLGQTLDHGGLRCDRVGRDHAQAAQAHGLGDGFVAERNSVVLMCSLLGPKVDSVVGATSTSRIVTLQMAWRRLAAALLRDVDVAPADAVAACGFSEHGRPLPASRSDA